MSSSWRLWAVRRALILGVSATLVLGCSRDTATTGPLGATDAYWSLQLNHHAIALALVPGYDTVQLHAVPLNYKGGVIQATGSITYRSLDTTVTVSPTGLVTARTTTAPSSYAHVVASMQDPTLAVTHEDTARIAVTAVPDTIVAFSMQPAVGDSAQRALTDLQGNIAQFPWSVIVKDTAQNTVCSRSLACTYPVYYASSASLVAAIVDTTGLVNVADTGRVVFRAEADLYGHTWRDSVIFEITPANGYVLYFSSQVKPLFVYAPDTIVITVGGVVTFFNFDPKSNDSNLQIQGPLAITFTPSAHVDTATDPYFGLPPTGSGDIAFDCDEATNPVCFSTSNEVIRSRRFSAAGVYAVHFSLLSSKTYYIQVIGHE